MLRQQGYQTLVPVRGVPDEGQLNQQFLGLGHGVWNLGHGFPFLVADFHFQVPDGFPRCAFLVGHDRHAVGPRDHQVVGQFPLLVVDKLLDLSLGGPAVQLAEWDVLPV